MILRHKKNLLQLLLYSIALIYKRVNHCMKKYCLLSRLLLRQEGVTFMGIRLTLFMKNAIMQS